MPAKNAPELTLRAALDEDSAGIIDLITRVYGEYPGVLMDVDGEEPELRAPASAFEAFWVVESGGEVVGCVGAKTTAADGPPVVELKKMYVSRDLRGRGLGRRLIEHVEAYARERGAARVELWSDTRFATAHAVYEHVGYRRTGAVRELHDISDTSEYEFTRELA